MILLFFLLNAWFYFSRSCGCFNYFIENDQISLQIIKNISMFDVDK